MQRLIPYFAYGSNMNPERARLRMPGAIPWGTAYLPDYRLTERLYADIDRNAGSTVYGVLYMLTHVNLLTLDRCEGCPTIYRRYWTDIICNGGKLRALVYEMTDDTKKMRNGIAYPDEYRRMCARGAEKYQIPNQFTRSL